MADNFFGFDSEFPSAVNVLGKLGLDEEITDVEEEYDALNDETFGQANNDDWEDAHEKLAVLIKSTDIKAQSVFNDSLLETDESQNEIVSKSISQLGLEDDIDDPAIMTISKNYSPHIRKPFSISPPPPAILETELCGSPKTHSIWSTTPKDSGIASFLKSISRTSDSFSQEDSSGPLNSSSDNVFKSPAAPKAWRAEELEKDLLSSSNVDHPRMDNTDWPPAKFKVTSHQVSNFTSSPRFSNVNDLNKISHEKMVTKDIDRHIYSDPRMNFPSKPYCWGPNLIPTNNKNLSGPVTPAFPRLRLLRSPILNNNVPVPDRPFMPLPYSVNARMSNMIPNQIGPLPFPFSSFKAANSNLNQSKMHNLPTRTITHPLMNKQFPAIIPINHYENEHSHYESDPSRNTESDQSRNTEDEYAGLMTSKEKEWLTRIQLLLLRLENPYLEDYYYTIQMARKCKQKFLEKENKGSGEVPELILPEMAKHENKTYVPTQFEGSLGKLQAVSVNFPRKVLDIIVARPSEEEEGEPIPSLITLRRHRRLLYDIEKLYNSFLLIDDEKRRILANPDVAHLHRKIITDLKEDIFNGLFCDNSTEEHFQNILTVRKGRTLVMRVLLEFSFEQQMKCLCGLFRCLPFILKRDQIDLVLIQYFNTITTVINKCRLTELLKLSEALENDEIELQSTCGKDKNGINAVLKHKFGSSIVCSLVIRAEDLYRVNYEYDRFEPDEQIKWKKFMQHLMNTLCSISKSAVSPSIIPCTDVFTHFKRFESNEDKLKLLEEILLAFEMHTYNKEINENV